MEEGKVPIQVRDTGGETLAHHAAYHGQVSLTTITVATVAFDDHYRILSLTTFTRLLYRWSAWIGYWPQYRKRRRKVGAGPFNNFVILTCPCCCIILCYGTCTCRNSWRVRSYSGTLCRTRRTPGLLTGKKNINPVCYVTWSLEPHPHTSKHNFIIPVNICLLVSHDCLNHTHFLYTSYWWTEGTASFTLTRTTSDLWTGRTPWDSIYVWGSWSCTRLAGRCRGKSLSELCVH